MERQKFLRLEITRIVLANDLNDQQKTDFIDEIMRINDVTEQERNTLDTDVAVFRQVH